MLKKSASFVRHWALTQDTAASPLGGVHKRDALYSARREPRCGRTAAAGVSRHLGWAGETDVHFEHPVGFPIVIPPQSSDCLSGVSESFFNSLLMGLTQATMAM